MSCNNNENISRALNLFPNYRMYTDAIIKLIFFLFLKQDHNVMWFQPNIYFRD